MPIKCPYRACCHTFQVKWKIIKNRFPAVLYLLLVRKAYSTFCFLKRFIFLSLFLFNLPTSSFSIFVRSFVRSFVRFSFESAQEEQ